MAEEATMAARRPRDPRLAPEPDAHGQAALLLVESLIHGLIANGTLSTDEALEIATSAAEVKEAVADYATESRATAERSLQMLTSMIASLEFDRSHAGLTLDGPDEDDADL